MGVVQSPLHYVVRFGRTTQDETPASVPYTEGQNRAKWLIRWSLSHLCPVLRRC